MKTSPESDLLWLQTACHLSGYPDIVIEWQKPESGNSNGLTIVRDRDLVIQITPGLDPDREFYTYLQEVAYCKLHHKALTGQDDEPAPLGMAMSPDQLKKFERCIATGIPRSCIWLKNGWKWPVMAIPRTNCAGC